MALQPNQTTGPILTPVDITPSAPTVNCGENFFVTVTLSGVPTQTTVINILALQEGIAPQIAAAAAPTPFRISLAPVSLFDPLLPPPNTLTFPAGNNRAAFQTRLRADLPPGGYKIIFEAFVGTSLPVRCIVQAFQIPLSSLAADPDGDGDKDI